MSSRNNSSIINRVSSYYSLILIVLVAILICVFFFVVKTDSISVSKKNLADATYNSFDYISGDIHSVEIDSEFPKYDKGANLVVYDENGNRIIGHLPSGFPSGTPLNNEVYTKVSGESETWLVYDVNDTYENGQTIWVRGIYGLGSNTGLIFALRIFLLIVIPLLILITIVVGRRMIKKALNPLADIVHGADDIQIGKDMDKRIPLPDRHDELYFLADKLNQMLDRIEAAFISEKQFSQDVSHELKTPLSVVLAQCEYILSEDRSNEEYVEAILQIQDDCKRILNLASQLLNLTRTFNKAELISKENVDLSIVCESVVEQMGSIASNVEVVGEIDDDVIVHADETLILRMIMNLVGNAVKYTGPKYENLLEGAGGAGNDGDGGFDDNARGQVKVVLEAFGDNGFRLSVLDNGIGIGKEHLDKIFNRFYMVDKSRSRESGDGFGLGLSMVKWICDAHDYKISVESQEGRGSKFTVVG